MREKAVNRYMRLLKTTIFLEAMLISLLVIAPVLADTTLVRGEAHNSGDAAGSLSFGDVSLVGSNGVDVVQTVGTLDNWTVTFSADMTYINANVTWDPEIDQAGGTSGTYGSITGLINGSNQRYDTSSTFVAANLQVYMNGILMLPDGDDYTVVDTDSFNMVTAPPTGSLLLVIY